jgi:hypothetical protein
MGSTALASARTIERMRWSSAILPNLSQVLSSGGTGSQYPADILDHAR